MPDQGIPRPGYKIYADSEEAGKVTSGTRSPSLERGIAIGYVSRRFAKAGTELTIDIRGRRLPAVIVKPPFYKQGSRK